jgi:hypothetical protein
VPEKLQFPDPEAAGDGDDVELAVVQCVGVGVEEEVPVTEALEEVERVAVTLGQELGEGVAEAVTVGVSLPLPNPARGEGEVLGLSVVEGVEEGEEEELELDVALGVPLPRPPTAPPPVGLGETEGDGVLLPPPPGARPHPSSLQPPPAVVLVGERLGLAEKDAVTEALLEGLGEEEAMLLLEALAETVRLPVAVEETVLMLE